MPGTCWGTFPTWWGREPGGGDRRDELAPRAAPGLGDGGKSERKIKIHTEGSSLTGSYLAAIIPRKRGREGLKKRVGATAASAPLPVGPAVAVGERLGVAELHRRSDRHYLT